MISAFCPRHGAEVLFSTSRIERIRNTPHGIRVAIRCYCGERLEILTGRPAAVA